MNRDAEVRGVVRIAGAPVCVCVCVYVKEESIFNENTFNLTNLMIINERNSQEDLYAFAFDDSFRASDDLIRWRFHLLQLISYIHLFVLERAKVMIR